jgi:hypothetical protein
MIMDLFSVRVRLVKIRDNSRKTQTRCSAGDQVVDLSDQLGDIQELIEGGPELQQSVHEFLGLLGKAHSQFSLTQVTLLPSI